MFHVTLKQLYCMDHVQYKINIYIMIQISAVFGLSLQWTLKGHLSCAMSFLSQVERQHNLLECITIKSLLLAVIWSVWSMIQNDGLLEGIFELL